MTEPQGEDVPHPSHPDSALRLAYWAALALAVIEKGERVGLDFALERALSDAWYEGVQEGIHRLAITQRQTMDAARAKAAAREAGAGMSDYNETVAELARLEAKRQAAS